MENKTLFQRIQGLPIGAVAVTLSAATLSSVYQNMGYQYIRHITMGITVLVLIAMIIKIIVYFDTFKGEYKNVVPCSIYAVITMLTMVLSGYIFSYNKTIGKFMWFLAIIVHILHILIFTFNNVIKGVKIDTFIPSWFVTYIGLLVSTVVGVPMNEGKLCRIIVIYGIVTFIAMLPFMIIRIIKKPVIGPLIHTNVILIAPPSLCIIGYINFFETPNKALVYLLYIILIIALVFNVVSLPKFFSISFNPGFAAMTFPMAIGTLASTKMSTYLINNGQESLGNIVKEIQGIQLYLTTAIVAFVVFNFIRMLRKKV